MFLPTKLPTRRTFLERSILGAGSLLFAPVLLDSCTDHIIPNPGPGETPISPPPLGDYTIDWNEAAKIAVTTGLEAIPEVGEILGPLADIFWPKSGEDVWGQVKDRVEALVDQKIADAVYQQVSEDLLGLQGVIINYQNELKYGTIDDIRSQWIVTKNLFAQAKPHFQSKGNELPLLGLFVQFTNLYVSLLRDGLIAGQSWGRSKADHQQDYWDFANVVTYSINYVISTYENGRDNLIEHTPRNDHKCEPFRTLNAYDRQMTLIALDFQQTWDYYDIYYHSNEKVPLTREIYSDPYGTCDDSGPIVLPSAPTQFPTNLTVWGGDRINAVQLTYPAGKGPGGVTQTNRMGAGGGSNQSPRGGSFNLSPDNPITQAKVASGDIVNAMQFGFNDGTTTNILGGGYVDPNRGPFQYTTINYTNEALSSIHINGVSNFYNSADCVVFGFQYWQSPAVTLKAIQDIYIKSPKEHSIADFGKAFPKLAISANLITDALKLARLAYWVYIKERAKKPK